MKRPLNFNKLLFVGDNHCDHVTPGSRCDNYMLATMDELQESLEVAREKGVGAVILLGDLFHRLEVSGECRNGVLRILKCDENGEKWPFEIFITIGNHDIKHNIQNLPKSSLGTLIEAGIVQYTEEAPEYGIRFAHFRNSLVDELKAGLMEDHPSPIWSVHGSITLMPYFGDFVVFEELPVAPETKLVVAGHIHFPMEQKREDGVQFINPGNVGRERATKENMSRQPQVLYVEHDGKFDNFSYEYIMLKRPRPADEIFKIDEIQARKDDEIDTKEYISQVNQIAVWTDSDDKYEALRVSGRMKQIDHAVIELAVETVELVNEERLQKQSI